METSLTSPAAQQGESRTRRVKTGLGLRVLVVEDDEQVATVLAALLETEGYEVSVAHTAESGLNQLRRKQFHLLVTDYWLPDRTGAWMLNEASTLGLLNGSQILVVTGEHRPQGVENLRVLRKPLDLDDFLRVVHDVLMPVREEELTRARQEVQHSLRENQPEVAPRIELALYVSSSSPSSLRALRNLRRLLADYDAGQVRLLVCDLSHDDGGLADEDRIVFTPTLVKRGPEPKVWVLGDLSTTEVVADLLSHAGVERTR